MKFKDKSGWEDEVTDKRTIQFINDMQKAGIGWRWYSGRGMYGQKTAGVSCGCGSDPVDEEDVIRATKVKGLSHDSMGRGTILYVG